MTIGTVRMLAALALAAPALSLGAGCGGDGKSVEVGGTEYELLEVEEPFPGRMVVRVSANTSTAESAVEVMDTIELVDGNGKTYAAEGDAGVTFTLTPSQGDDEGRKYEFELAYEMPAEAAAGSKLRMAAGGETGELELGLD